MASLMMREVNVLQPQSSEFSRTVSDFTGEFYYRFYLYDAEQALIIDTEAPKITSLH